MKKAIIHQHYPLDYAGEEALNSICTNLAFIGTDKRKIVITSNSQSEGKSWMTMHIAENMARRGRHVVLVDADMRRSFMVQRYKLELEGARRGLAPLPRRAVRPERCCLRVGCVRHVPDSGGARRGESHQPD